VPSDEVEVLVGNQLVDVIVDSRGGKTLSAKADRVDNDDERGGKD
jgi:hypothetical protein